MPGVVFYICDVLREDLRVDTLWPLIAEYRRGIVWVIVVCWKAILLLRRADNATEERDTFRSK